MAKHLSIPQLLDLSGGITHTFENLLELTVCVIISDFEIQIFVPGRSENGWSQVDDIGWPD
jgi:hypothetical protein